MQRHDAQGDAENASLFAAKVMDYRHPDYLEENSKLYLQLAMLKQYGRQEDAERLVSRVLMAYPENNYIRWAADRYRQGPGSSGSEKGIASDSGFVSAYDTGSTDKDFDLLLGFLEEIEGD